MQASKHYIDGFLNADDEANQVAPNEAVRVVNMRFTERRRWESIASNVEKVNPFLPSSGNTAIGWMSDEATRAIILFNYNAAGSGIYFYNGTWYKVLTETQVTGGLNFQKNSLITARLVNGLLTWTDNMSEPKSISIYSALRANSILQPPVQNAATTSPGGNLAANTYFYVISALNGAGETIKSNEVSVTTSGTTSANSLSWTAVTGATSYRVYRGLTAGGENVYYAVGNVTSYTDTGATATTGAPSATNTTTLANPVQTAPTTVTTGGTLGANTYYYVITAINAVGETLKSNEFSITTTGTTSTNTINWGAVAGATGYKIYRGVSAGGENLFYSVGNVTTFSDTGASGTFGSLPASNTTTLSVPTQNTATTNPGGTLAAGAYFYVITALTAQGETTKSNEITITTTGTTSSITLNWQSVPGATGYNIYRGTATGAENAYFTAGAAGVSYVDIGTIAPTSGNPPTSNTSYTFSSTAYPYTFPIRYESSTIIRRPPIFPLTVVKAIDSSYSANNIESEAFQFLYYYEYRNRQISSLSPYSKLMPFNFSGESNNAIDVTLSFSEKIDDECLFVYIVAKAATTNKMTVVKIYDKGNQSDNTAITNHNAGTTALTFRFYNDTTGQILDNILSATPFHPVALKAYTLEVAKNRLFLGGILSGYDSPRISSISATTTTTNTSSTGSFAGQWNYVTLHANYQPGVQNTYNYPYVTSSTAPSPIYYFSSVRNSSIWDGGVGTVPATVNISDGIAFATITDLVTYLKNTQYPSGSQPVGNPTWLAAYETYTINTSGNGTGGCTLQQYTTNQIQQFFKSYGTYEVAISFYDRFRRKCGVVRGAKVTMPARTYAQSTFTSAINWKLTNTADMTAEIPSWAYYYQIHITRNLTTRNFIQAVSAGQSYMSKTTSGNLFSSSYSQTAYAIAIDISKLNGLGIGYTYTAGDFCRLYLDSPASTYNLAIIGQEGNNIYLRAKDIGAFSTTLNIIFEIYTPYKPSVVEPFYETGPVFPISNPGQAYRTFTTTAGVLNGDCYSLQRAKDGTTNYIAEAMSPNDNLWSRWMTDTGWDNIVTTLGQENKPSAIQFSDTFVEGTRTNGLNVFQPLNQETLPITMGGLQKLILTSKVEEEGNVMLAIGKNQTASIYIGETQVTNADTTSYFVKSTGVISQVNILKGDFGTQNPESVVVFKGDAYWIDTNSGRFIEYSVNGLDEISAGENGMFKFKRFTKGFCAAFNSFTSAQIEANGSRPFIFGGVDPHFKEILWTIPYVGSNPNGSLVDYNSIPTYMDNNLYPYDTLDYSYKTISFRKGIAKWQGEYSFTPEGMVSLGSDLYSMINGKLFLHNAGTTFNNFYGTPYRSKIAISLNKDNVVKEFRAISIESSEAPEWVHFRSEYPYEQSTDLIATDFISRDGIFDGGIKRDRLTPNPSGYDAAQESGDLIRSQAIYSLIQFNNPNTLVWFRQATVGYNPSSGHY